MAFSRWLAGWLSAAALTGQAAGQDGFENSFKGFDPRSPCGTVLRGASDQNKLMVAAWVFGFLSGNQGSLHPVNLETAKAVLRNVFDACAQDENKSLLEIVKGSRDRQGQDPASEESARKLLLQFLKPGADFAALTSRLKPSGADIRAVYTAPLAEKLVDMYGSMFASGASIGPKPGQTGLITVRATTAALRDGDAILREFPGGYEKVRTFFAGDHPIIRFKFVRQGETLGMAFDGLVFVNGRWVLMPKPWRALD